MDVEVCEACTRRVVTDSQQDQLSFDDQASICTCEADRAESAPSTPIQPQTNRTESPPKMQPRTEGKPRPNSRQTAARAVRRWAKIFQDEHNLDFPKCLDGMKYIPPVDIYKKLDLDKGPLLRVMDTAGEAGHAREVAKINYAVTRDLLKHKSYPPRYLTYFHKDNQESTVSKEEFWFMLSDTERAELIRESYEDAVILTCEKIRSKAAAEHYKSCIRHIKGGLEAIRIHMRESNTKRQRTVDDYFAKRKKRRADKIAADLTNGLALSHFIIDEAEFM